MTRTIFSSRSFHDQIIKVDVEEDGTHTVVVDGVPYEVDLTKEDALAMARRFLNERVNLSILGCTGC